jgi:hypothetical protein
MADRCPVGVVAALGADQPGDVFGQHGLEHLQARPDRQREQALAGGASKLGDRDAHLPGQLEFGTVSGGGAVGILRHGGPLLVERLGGCPTPTTRQASGGDRHLNFHGNRDNLATSADGRARGPREPARPTSRDDRTASCLFWLIGARFWVRHLSVVRRWP